MPEAANRAASEAYELCKRVGEAAKALGLAITDKLLALADDVIE